MLNLHFYKNFYPDLNNLNNKELIQHWNIHGKFERRVPNLKVLQDKKTRNINKNLNIINKIKIYNNFNFNFNIIIRTHNRPENFKKSLNSVLLQTYKKFNIIVGYDNLKSLEYLKNYKNIIKIRTFKNSNNSAFYDDYFNQLYEHVEKNSFIIMLDDDNYFISNNCLKVINNCIKNKILLFKFISPLKEIYPKNLKDIKYGELDTACICFHSSLINQVKWKDKYGSDYNFIKELLEKNKFTFVNMGFIATQYNDKINNNYKYFDYSEYLNKKIGPERIDFEDYLNYYPDLKKNFGDNLDLAKKHYLENGWKESRVVKFKDFNWEKFKNNFINNLEYGTLENKVVLITSLYNENSQDRLNEYIFTLKFNLKNPNIKKIIIFYDTSKNRNTILEKLFSDDKINIIEIKNRPKFFELNKICENGINIICNADIIFDESLNNIFNYNLENKVLGLTRWDFISEEKAIPRRDYLIEKNKNPEDTLVRNTDVWIFKDKLKNKNLEEIVLGTWGCDSKFIDNCLENKIKYISECLNIKSYHIHFSNNRNYSK